MPALRWFRPSLAFFAAQSNPNWTSQELFFGRAVKLSFQISGPVPIIRLFGQGYYG